MGRAAGGRWEGGGRATGRRVPWREARVASLLHVEVDLVNGGALVAHADVVLAGGVRRHREVSSGVLVLEEHLPRGRTDLCVALVISTRRRPVAGEQTSDRDRLRDAALVRGLELEGHTVARAGVERKGEGKDAARHRRHTAGRKCANSPMPLRARRCRVSPSREYLVNIVSGRRTHVHALDFL